MIEEKTNRKKITAALKDKKAPSEEIQQQMRDLMSSRTQDTLSSIIPLNLALLSAPSLEVEPTRKAFIVMVLFFSSSDS